MMQLSAFLLFLCIAGVYSGGNRLESFRTVDDYLNICIDGQNHKKRPGPESTMFNLCSPYKDWACCTSETSNLLLANSTWYNFSWDHCGRLSDKCRRHFQRDLCFYECSPNVGPWLVQEDRKWRKERFMNVPLCRSDCEAWFNDCSDDLTCVPNWSKDFVWKSGIQSCPTSDPRRALPCTRIGDMYATAQDFCEKIWDHSWKVVDDSTKMCMKIDFKKYDIANNARVAQHRAQELVDTPLRTRNSGAVNTAIGLAIELFVGIFIFML